MTNNTPIVSNTHIILFDGVCNLCNKSVQFIIKRDKQAKFKFAALQSKTGQSLLNNHKLLSENFTSVIYINNNNVYERSTAVLHILKELGGIWKLMYGFIIIPTFIRNVIYDAIAENRYKLWGKRASCMTPTPDLQNRFL